MNRAEAHAAFGEKVPLFGVGITLTDYDDATERIIAAARARRSYAVSALAVHGLIGFELGPPFLRLYGDVRWTISLSQTEDWWGLRPGPLSALLGFVIRF